MQINTDWEQLLEELVSHQVRFLVVGGIAVGAYGHVRYTKDLDLWVEPSERNAQYIVDALTAFFGEDIGVRAEQFSEPELLTKLGKEPFRIDFITSLKGVEFGVAYDQRELFKLGEQEVPFISLEHLLKVKKEAGRPQDLADVATLEKRRNKA